MEVMITDVKLASILFFTVAWLGFSYLLKDGGRKQLTISSYRSITQFSMLEKSSDFNEYVNLVSWKQVFHTLTN